MTLPVAASRPQRVGDRRPFFAGTPGATLSAGTGGGVAMTHLETDYSSLPPPPTPANGADGRNGSLRYAIAALVLVSIAWIGLLVDDQGSGGVLGICGPVALIVAIVAITWNRGQHQGLVLSLGVLTIALVFAGTITAFGRGLQDLGEDLDLGGWPSSTSTDVSKDCLTAQEGRAPSHKPADLYRCDLTGVDLTGVDLSGADLSYASLAHVAFVDANLSGADLSGANLFEANLTGANLTSANLSHTDLTLADLTGVNLTRATLFSTRWFSTTCPDGSKSGSSTTDTQANTCLGHGI